MPTVEILSGDSFTFLLLPDIKQSFKSNTTPKTQYCSPY